MIRLSADVVFGRLRKPGGGSGSGSGSGSSLPPEEFSSRDLIDACLEASMGNGGAASGMINGLLGGCYALASSARSGTLDDDGPEESDIADEAAEAASSLLIAYDEAAEEDSGVHPDIVAFCLVYATLTKAAAGGRFLWAEFARGRSRPRSTGPEG